EIIGEPLSNFYKLSKEDTIKRVEELLEKVGMNRSDKNKFPHQFSGGQLQRICIARALALSPSLLVLDEPLSSLDISIQAQILNLLSDLKKDLDLTYILISHDLEAVYYLSDSIVVMYKGRIMEHIEDIKDFYEMRHPYTKRLLASSYQYRSKVDDFIEEVNNSESIDGCPYFNRCINGRDICKENSPKLVEVSEGHKVACHYA
ncbi:MAG: ABC transporter ATP-binding protein, partial [Paeniclostridium sordellii]|nr:ABC transporter ATP-binding protein [Paeniclostridium sordellii]